MKRLKHKRGFTLVEVLVVVVVITILAVITIMGYSSIQGQSRDEEREAKARVIAGQLEKYYEENGEYPSVAALVGQPAATVQSKLKLTDPRVLVFPTAPASTDNSLTRSEASTTQLAYNGESIDNAEDARCVNDVNGGCDEFNLRWQTEAGETQNIPSIHQGREIPVGGAVPNTPSAPNISVSLVGTNIVASVDAVTCDNGAAAEYKIIHVTNTTGDDPVFPAWSSISWSSNLTKTISGTEGNHYYFKAIAHCVNTAGVSNDSDESEIVEYYYSTADAPKITATISGTTVNVTVTPSTPCPAGSTAMYQIWEKKDTTSAAGTWTVISTRNFTTANTYAGTAGANASPTKNSYRASVRCDSGGSLGTVSPSSPTVFVVSAPTAPTLSKNTPDAGGYANSITWSWTKPVCPVGTTPYYTYTWAGDYTNKGKSVNTLGTSVALTTSSQGYQYNLTVKAACGTPITNQVPYGPSSNSAAYTRFVDSDIWVYKGSLRTRRPDAKNYPNTVFGQTIVHATRNVPYNGSYTSPTPNAAYPANGNCAAGLVRKIQWRWALDSIGDNAWRAWSGEYTWANGTSRAFPAANTIAEFRNAGMVDLDKNPNYTTTQGNNSKVEFSFYSWCENPTTGRAGPKRYSDNFGNLTALEHDGRFHTFCEADAEVPWCKAWHSSRNPLSAHVGEWAGHDAGTGTCRGGGYPDDRFCFTPIYSANSAPWGW